MVYATLMNEVVVDDECYLNQLNCNNYLAIRRAPGSFPIRSPMVNGLQQIVNRD